MGLRGQKENGLLKNYLKLLSHPAVLFFDTVQKKENRGEGRKGVGVLRIKRLDELLIKHFVHNSIFLLHSLKPINPFHMK